MHAEQQSAEGATRYVAPSGMSDPRPWFVYARKSRKGVGATITKENQWGACTDYARAWAGPNVPLVYFFDNASGWDEEAKRPDWDDMLCRIKAGEAAGVVAWHVDRYTRQVDVGEALWKLCKRNATQLHTKLGGQQTSALAFTVQNAVARDESDVKSERQKLKQAQLAADGLHHGGRRVYGWNLARDAVVPEEQAHIVWAARQVIAGQSLRSVAKGLESRGARTASGTLWTGSNLGTYLKRPMLVAQRVHHGQVVGPATWPPLLDMATWRAVVALLSDPSRRTSKAQTKRWLLSNIARCGTCGGPMRGKANSSGDRPPAYHCHLQSQGHAYRRADMVDAQVRTMVVARLAEIDATGALAEPADQSAMATLEGAVEAIETRMDAIAVMGVRGELTPRQVQAATAEANRELEPLRAELASLSVEATRPHVLLEGLAGLHDAEQRFDALDLERQRAVISLLCSVVIHAPATPQRGHSIPYDPSLVEVTWLT